MRIHFPYIHVILVALGELSVEIMMGKRQHGVGRDPIRFGKSASAPAEYSGPHGDAALRGTIDDDVVPKSFNHPFSAGHLFQRSLCTNNAQKLRQNILQFPPCLNLC